MVCKGMGTSGSDSGLRNDTELHGKIEMSVKSSAADSEHTPHPFSHT